MKENLGLYERICSPPKATELAGAFPRVVGESEGFQFVKGEGGGQLVQAIVLQVDVFQCGHTQEGTVGELGGKEGRSERISVPVSWLS